MTSNKIEQIQLALWNELAGESLSVSHDRWHVERVLGFAYQLQALYDGNIEVVTAAVIMHDLGRSDPNLRGQASIDRSTELAREILARIEFSADKAEQVIIAIDDHDKPDLTPRTVEGRILKDADFLAGFGAWGILRIGLWAGETGGGIDQVMDRLEHRMAKRVEKLEFPESECLARREMMFARLFFLLLKQQPELTPDACQGLYIVLEGISGSGKDTQAYRLHDRLKAEGHRAVVVCEPTSTYREVRKILREKYHEHWDDPIFRKFLFMADRRGLTATEVSPALERNEIVISVRSFITTMIYQCHHEIEALETAFVHRFAPLPDIVILLDLEPSLAKARNENRTGEKEYEGKRISLLKRQRHKYKELCSSLFETRLKLVNASSSIDDVADKIWEIVIPIVKAM